MSLNTDLTISPQMVERYYLKNFSQLKPAQQFHLASRLFLFSQKTKMNAEIKKLQPYFSLQKNTIAKYLHTSINDREYYNNSINFRIYRKPYFEKYPLLPGFNKTFFSLLFQKTIYGEDFFSELKKSKNYQDILDYHNRLINDSESVFNLATRAINFLFLSSLIIPELKEPNIDVLVKISQTNVIPNDHTSTINSQILILTHIIICKSEFYNKRTLVNEDCNKVFSICEALIDKNYYNISLDQKIEFLVCGKILNQNTYLEEMIMLEAKKSKHPKANYIIDTHNTNSNKESSKSFNNSEHRNALYIMSHY